MSETLKAAQRISFHAELSFDASPAPGLLLQLAGAVDVELRRPDGFRIDYRNEFTSRDPNTRSSQSPRRRCRGSESEAIHGEFTTNGRITNAVTNNSWSNSRPEVPQSRKGSRNEEDDNGNGHFFERIRPCGTLDRRHRRTR
jgi:hypothetical protein